MATITPKIPSVITRANAERVLEMFRELPYFQIGSHERHAPAWVHQEVVLEFPLGELARDGMLNMALLGRNKFRNAPLTGKENFDAQGLEGKVQVVKPLTNAVFNLDLLPMYRGRVLTGAIARRAMKKSGDRWRTR